MAVKRSAPRILTRLFFAVCCLLPTAYCFAQTDNDTETIRVDTQLVDLNVSVMSRDPLRTIGALAQKDFAVAEDGVPQEIAFFASADAPFDLILLLDLSGSTANKANLIGDSAKRFVRAARPVDRIGIITFTTDPKIISPLTSDREQLEARLKKIKRTELAVGTNFWDSLRYTLEKVLDADSPTSTPTRRRAVIVMTDGVDNALPEVEGDGSLTRFDQLLEIVRRSDAIIIPIYLDTEREMVRDEAYPRIAYWMARQQLSLLADNSGGLLYQASKIEDLKGVYEQVIHDLGTVYSIGYRPTKRERDGTWRAINVQLVNHPELSVRAKRGYYAK